LGNIHCTVNLYYVGWYTVNVDKGAWGDMHARVHDRR
jgi:hypothetical protein